MTSATYRQLITDATLAPSSHNTQPWRFEIDREALRISIRPDLTRRCHVVDPDDHHLWTSLGCAVENLVTSAVAHGLRATVTFTPAVGDRAVVVALAEGGSKDSRLAGAIEARQCTRTAYDGHQPPGSHIDALVRAATSDSGGLLLLTDTARMRLVADYVAEANRVQLNDAAFLDELVTWVRFTRAEAERTRDGLWSRASGRPELPRWLLLPFKQVVFSADAQAKRDRVHIASSAGIAVFYSHDDTVPAWLDVGRRYERFALEATARGLKNAFVNQPIEVENMRGQFAQSLGLPTARADLVVRFGYAPSMPRSLRRPVERVVETAAADGR